MAELNSQGLKIGLLPVMDPRIDPDLEQRILGYLALEQKLCELGIEVVWPGRAVSAEEDAVEHEIIVAEKAVLRLRPRFPIIIVAG